jgi:hypothetical protein
MWCNAWATDGHLGTALPSHGRGHGLHLVLARKTVNAAHRCNRTMTCRSALNTDAACGRQPLLYSAPSLLESSWTRSALGCRRHRRGHQGSAAGYLGAIGGRLHAVRSQAAADLASSLAGSSLVRGTRCNQRQPRTITDTGLAGHWSSCQLDRRAFCRLQRRGHGSRSGLQRHDAATAG